MFCRHRKFILLFLKQSQVTVVCQLLPSPLLPFYRELWNYGRRRKEPFMAFRSLGMLLATDEV